MHHIVRIRAVYLVVLIYTDDKMLRCHIVFISQGQTPKNVYCFEDIVLQLLLGINQSLLTSNSQHPYGALRSCSSYEPHNVRTHVKHI